MLIDPKIEEVGLAAVDLSQLAGVTYADCRVVEVTEEEIRVRDGAIDALSRSQSLGIGLRVLAHGAWGFASTAEVTPEATLVLRERAIEIARASNKLAAESVELAPVKPVQGTYRTKIKKNPFDILLKEKLQYAMHLDSLIRAVPDLNRTSAGMSFRREVRHFFSTEGSRIHQEIFQSGAEITAEDVAERWDTINYEVTCGIGARVPRVHT